MFPFLIVLACTDKPTQDTDTTVVDTDTTDTADDSMPVTTAGCTDRHDAFVAALEADLAASDAPGVSAAIMENGEVTCQVALGSKQSEADVPADINTLFQLGSTTKMFTAMAMLQRVDAGSLRLDMSLAEAYPDSEFAQNPDWNDAITLHQLLTHEGGFIDYVDSTTTEDDAGLAEWYTEVYFPNLWLMVAPGSFWNYTNPGFDIAGLVTESDDGRAYPDILIDSVFVPLGMDRTMQRKASVLDDGNYAESHGYFFERGSVQYGPVSIDDVPDPAAHRPAGVSTWSTPTQVLKMATFLMEGDDAVLGDTLRGAMTTDQVGLGYPSLDTAYGYGVMVDTRFDSRDGQSYPMAVWSHNGNTNSYTSEFWMVPEQNFAVSILSSGYGTDFYGAVETSVLSLLELPDPFTVTVPAIDPTAIARHVGQYTDPNNVGDFTITQKGDQLFVEAPLLESLGYTINPELYGYSDDVWYMQIDGSYYDLTFITDGDDASTTWIRNRAFVLSRSAEKLHGASTPTTDGTQSLAHTLHAARVHTAELPAAIRNALARHTAQQ